jgi:hypothetical protein
MEATFRATHRATRDTVYYETGPQQGEEPNGLFKAGTDLMSLEDNIGGYLRVRAQDRREGYVDEQDLDSLR